jgi:hypothetical protein
MSPVASFVLVIHFSNESFQMKVFVIRVAHLARSIIENQCWEGLDRIFRQIADVWTLRRRKGVFVSESKTS